VTDEEKPVLVLLHGWGMHAGVWNDLAERLGAGCSVIAPDLPGYGAAPPMTDAGVEDVVDRLAKIAPPRCAVAGWSLGGQLALAWALRHPQQIARMVLLASTPRFVAAGDWPQGMATNIFAEFATQLKADRDGTLRRFRRLQAEGDAQLRSVVRRLDAVASSLPAPSLETLECSLNWLGTMDLRDTLHEIMQPTLLLHGAEDRLVAPAAATFMAEQLPDARLSLIPGAAHAPFISAVNEVAREMIGFCSER